MKKILLTIFSLLLLSSNPLSATTFYGSADLYNAHYKNEVKIRGSARIKKSEFESEVSISGSADIEESQFTELNISGSTSLDEVQFDNAVISGSFEGKEIEFNDIAVKGSADFDKAKSDGTVIVSGSLKIENSNLNIIEVKSRKGNVLIDDTSVNKIIVNSAYTRITVEGDTKIDLIDFKKTGGIVIIKDKNAKVEKVEGGKIEKQ